ncbi:putative type III export protein, partial [Vibrio parahaemolyticus V-223/04]
GTTV